MYDIIGDVHGQASLLKGLLKGLGYVKTLSGYSHPGRQAIFVGDFINRGPDIRETLRIVREMVENGKARAILGNHEINALLFHLKSDAGDPLLPPKGKRAASVIETVREFKNLQEEWKGHRQWLRSLPLFLEMDGLRVVHACWKDRNVENLKKMLPDDKLPKQILKNLVLDHTSELSQSILQTIRGIHHILPPDIRIFDNRHRMHHFYRVKWWMNPDGLTFQDWSFESKFRLPAYTIPPEIIPETEIYHGDDPIVFFGHYCRGNGPFVISDNLCCVDACVMGTRRLAAYRWNGETQLSEANLVFTK